jgi:hypothetical protein
MLRPSAMLARPNDRLSNHAAQGALVTKKPTCRGQVQRRFGVPG